MLLSFVRVSFAAFRRIRPPVRSCTGQLSVTPMRRSKRYRRVIFTSLAEQSCSSADVQTAKSASNGDLCHKTSETSMPHEGEKFLSDSSRSDYDEGSSVSKKRQPGSIRRKKPSRRQPRKSSEAKSRSKEADATLSAGRGAEPNNSELTEVDVLLLRSKLLSWYKVSHRKFPWRAAPRYNDDGPSSPRELLSRESFAGLPYAVWISEVMSQQTRIEVVVDYFSRWMQRFPDIQSLADASLDEVNAMWAGLGYYRRAKHAHEAAHYITKKLNGQFPCRADQLLLIPGIGAYTAGAVASIAFDQPVPAVDGNVTRVLSRLRPQGPNVRRLAERLVENCDIPGDFNQAIMELGATVCTPRTPSCSTCPIRSLCGARAESLTSGLEAEQYVTRYPVKRKKPRVRTETRDVAVLATAVDDESTFLTVQRPPDGLLPGLWEAYNQARDDSAGDASYVGKTQMVDKAGRRLLRQLQESLPSHGCRWHEDVRVFSAGDVTHIFSHIRQTLCVSVAVVRPSRKPGCRKCQEFWSKSEGLLDNDVPFRWIKASDLFSSAVSTQMRKVFALAMEKMAEEQGMSRSTDEL